MPQFMWYDLMTTDVAAAETFYGSVVGWTFGAPGIGTTPYRMISAGGLGIGGIVDMSPEKCAEPESHPAWIGYIAVDDVDEAARGVEGAGGKLYKTPREIPEVGRFAVAGDPDGAPFILFKPYSTEPRPELPQTALGAIGWHELYAADLDSDFAFYEGLFGWRIVDTIDMGEYGPYRLVSPGGDAVTTGAMKLPPGHPAPPHWSFYFVVDSVEAAAERVRASGGKVLMGPQEVPGGSYILQCVDPQGAAFSLTSANR